MNFENWINREPQKLAKIRVFKVDYFDLSCKNSTTRIVILSRKYKQTENCIASNIASKYISKFPSRPRNEREKNLPFSCTNSSILHAFYVTLKVFVEKENQKLRKSRNNCTKSHRVFTKKTLV